MGYSNVALIGKARSGKDTVAARLIQQAQYTRVAFADPLKELALALDPILGANACGTFKLSEMVSAVGWETVKDTYPEARRVLQRLGAGLREMDEGFWLDILARKVATAHAWGLPVVVTDVRYRNEARALAAAGFKLIRVVRPGADPVGHGEHASETELDDWATDGILLNDGSLADLADKVDALLTP